jgi:hypothetical protein
MEIESIWPMTWNSWNSQSQYLTKSAKSRSLQYLQRKNKMITEQKAIKDQRKQRQRKEFARIRSFLTSLKSFGKQ